MRYENLDEEELIVKFWQQHINGNIDNDLLDKIYDEFIYYLSDKLNEHGLLGFDDFYEYHSERLIYDICGFDKFTDNFCYTNELYNYSLTKDDVLEVLIKLKWEKCRDAFSQLESFKKLIKLYEDFKGFYSKDKHEKVMLIDRLIHAQHETGDLIDSIDIPYLRECFENGEYDC